MRYAGVLALLFAVVVAGIGLLTIFDLQAEGEALLAVGPLLTFLQQIGYLWLLLWASIAVFAILGAMVALRSR